MHIRCNLLAFFLAMTYSVLATTLQSAVELCRSVTWAW
jgi:hypothetical protein